METQKENMSEPAPVKHKAPRTPVTELSRKDLLARAKSGYLKRFPVAALMDTQLWVVKLTFIKMTDNRLGFGKKLVWEKG